ncbi:MAG: tRNA pseudouridine(54/55) synthase Pus10 [Nitrosopumilaceae archaeon]
MQSYQKTKINNIVIDKVLSRAKIILNEFSLCEYCIGRLFAKKIGLTSNQQLGKKIQNQLSSKPSKKCYICKGILSNLEPIVYRIREKCSDYEFSTFVIGAILKPSITDRDDLIRSKFKLQGIDSVKTAITKELSKRFQTKTKKQIDFLNPDLTITFNFKDDSCELRSKPLIFSGRYIKKNRGFPQKQTPCINCKGKGCMQCENHGFSKYTSVEGKISKFLFDKFSGTQTKITWFGGEDKNSLVLGNGRPFFIKLFNPKKRKARLQKKYVLGEIEIQKLKNISKIPKHVIPFRSKIEISILSENKLNDNNFNNLKTIIDTPITIYEKPSKKNHKSIYDLKFKKSSQKSFSLWITADGGLPIKRFVEGNDVFPNISDVLGTKCRCDEYDIHRVDLLHLKPNF